MSQTVTSADGTRIGYDRFGDGPAVILVAGATKFRAFDPETSQVARLLADQGFTTVVYDRRGRGESTDTAPYAVAREVEDLAALINAVGGSAALYGISSGAVLALWAAQANIGVSKLLLWEPPLTAEDDGQAFLAGLRERLIAKDREGAIAFFMGEVAPEWLDGLRESPAYGSIWNVAPTLAYDAEVVADALTGTPWSVQWAAVGVPTLVMLSNQTLDVIEEAATALAAALPHATRRIIGAEQPHLQAPMMASVLAKALVPTDACGWSCAHCRQSARQAERAAEWDRVDSRGPVPQYED